MTFAPVNFFAVMYNSGLLKIIYLYQFSKQLSFGYHQLSLLDLMACAAFAAFNSLKSSICSHTELAQYRDLGFHDQTTEIMPEQRGQTSPPQHPAAEPNPSRNNRSPDMRVAAPPLRNSTPARTISPIKVGTLQMEQLIVVLLGDARHSTDYQVLQILPS
jgi:hypothetical protein